MTLIEAKVEAAKLSRSGDVVFVINNIKKEEVEISKVVPKDRSIILTVYQRGSEWKQTDIDVFTFQPSMHAVAPDPKLPKLSHSHTGTKVKPPRKVATTDISRKLKESIAKETLKKPPVEEFKKAVEKDPVVRRATKEINKNTSALKAALEKYKNSKPPVNAPAKNVVASSNKKGKNKR